MTTDLDPRTRIVLSWLREDAHENAERMLLRALDEVDTTPRRPPFGAARRTLPMHANAKLAVAAVAAAAVVAVAIVGWQLLPSLEPSGRPTPTPGASADPSAGSVLASPGASGATPVPTLPPPSRTVTIGAPFELPVEVTVPADWTPNTVAAGQYDFTGGREGGPYLGFFLVDRVYKDPCRPKDGWQHDRVLGPMAPDELVLDFQDYPAAFETSGRSGVVVDGRPAEHVVLTNTATPGTDACPAGPQLPLFVARGADVSTVSRSRQEFWAVSQVDTRLLLIAAELGSNPQPGDQSLIDAIVGTVRIGSNIAPLPTPEVVAGQNIFRAGDPFPEAVSVVVPSDWTASALNAQEFVVGSPARHEVGFYVVSGVYNDPCHSDDIRRSASGPPGPAELEAWLTEVQGFRTLGPTTSMTIGGRPARNMALSNEIDPTVDGCINAPVLPLLALDDKDGTTGIGVIGGARQHIFIIEPVGNGPTYVVLTTDIGASVAHAHPEELDAIINSISFPG